jgi:hypothetical protein
MYGGSSAGDRPEKCCRPEEISSVPIPRHGVKRHGKSKEGAKAYLMGANDMYGMHCLKVTRRPGSSMRWF